MTHTNSVLSLFSPFIETRKTKKKKQKKSNLQQLGGLVTRNSFAFCL